MNTRHALGRPAQILLALLVPAICARAQTAPADSAPPATTTTTVTTTTSTSATAPAGDVVKMESFQVNDVPADKIILPTARPFTSVFGTDDNIIDVPRDVTIISREQMDAIGIQDVTEFSKLTSSSYTDSNFGAPGNPSIRGQSADLFINGMRQRVTSNGNGMPVDFNSVESVNIVKGPATAVQGASAYVGGFADLISKQPFFDGFHGTSSYTIGSYATNRWNADVGGPITSNLAYRISYSGEYSDTYWDGAVKRGEAIYGALTWKNGNYEVEINSKAYFSRYSENFGIDRPTQLLISQGLYQTGININNGAAVAPSDSQNSKYVNGSNTIAFGPLVPVDYHWRLQGPSARSDGHEYNTQVIQTAGIGTDAKVVNNTFFSLTQRDTYSPHYYSEIISPSWFIDNRTEFIDVLKGLNSSTINVGVEERYQHTKAYDDFFFEPANAWDLSKARSGLVLDSINFPSNDFATVPVPGYPGRYATPGIINDDTNDSQEYGVSPFLQATWKLTPQLNLVTGARVDIMHFIVKDPLAVETGFLAKTEPKADISVSDPNANVSLVYKITPSLSAYATYNNSKNYSGAIGVGGGFAGLVSNPNGVGYYLPRSNFDQLSELGEAGLKLSALNNTLFLSSAIFDQTRQAKPQGQPAVTEQFKGGEFEVNYQPDKHLYATFGYSLLVGSEGTPIPFQAYSTNQVPNGPPNPNTSVLQTKGKLRVPGFPEHTFNGLLSYNFDNGFGVSGDVVVTSTMNNDYQGYLVIPWQYTLDADVHYRWKNWLFKIGGTNVTNQHNWTPAYPTYGLEEIVPDAGAEIFGTVRVSF
jgi:outer membrane receptor protein involved in Fe transport